MSLWQEHIQKDVRPAITGKKIHPKRCLACYYMQKNHPKRCKACYYMQKNHPKRYKACYYRQKSSPKTMSGLLLQAKKSPKKKSFHPQFATFIMSAIICRKKLYIIPKYTCLCFPTWFTLGNFLQGTKCLWNPAELCKIIVEPLQAKKIFM